jgi:hypothetical protein
MEYYQNHDIEQTLNLLNVKLKGNISEEHLAETRIDPRRSLDVRY